MGKYISFIVFIMFGFCMMYWAFQKDLDYYREEITRQEKVIKEQHGKLCMLDGILRNEIKHFTLRWVDIECQ